MRSSTSNSDLSVATAVLLVTLIAVAAALELAATNVGIRSSRILTRIDAEHKGIRNFSSNSSHPKTVVLVGNSLLLEGLDYSSVKEKLLATGWDSRRFIVEETGYYDWYFGLRRLLSEGCKPDVFVLMLNARQLALNSYAGPAFAYNLMRPNDILDVMKATNIHPTEVANLLLERESVFWGLRVEFRKHLLFSLFPGMTALAQRLYPFPVPMPGEVVHARLLRRMSDLAATAASLRVRLILVIPPAVAGTDYADDAIQAGQRAGITVMRPTRAGELPEDQFRDGFHLNPRGARTFTAIFTPALIERLQTFKE